ncbi:MAG: SusD/RagB family nutrient-binding outer membrane lipoprotein [Firmicutes bacterium]|nr:SusD/RagB family nutrient-binding outer membrane lipoprotein [Bacillota bacterium]MCM1401529.1 SusD/RagB family nutrient-binding outer membrane lipoprotein [Bacteroides sp.]MCM1476575.1 SusD/RagB family nutrient-binding outer membrane lipoprotein [Bacteroides sp.]
MKLNYIKLAAIALPVLGFTACMDFDTPSDEFTSTQTNVEEVVYSGNPDSIPYQFVAEEDSVADAINTLFPNFSQMLTAQYYIRGGKGGSMPQEHQYQYVYNLHIDNYAGYCVCDQNFDGRLVTTYSYYREFCDGPYGSYKDIRNDLANTLNHPMVDRLPEIKAICLLLLCYSTQEMVDIYGSVPFTDFKHNKQEAPFTFEAGSEIYRGVINNIDTIDACFAAFDAKPQWYKDQIQSTLAFPADGITHNKDIKSWRRFANSLKLRMAMHFVKYDATLAKKWAEEAVAAGVVETTDQEIVLDQKNGLVSNPLTFITNTWNDSRLNASFESLLASLNHPYLDYVFALNSDPITNTATGEVLPAKSRVVGLRAGLVMYPGQTTIVNPRCAYSAFKLDDWDADPVTYSAMSDAPCYFIKVSEMDFLRAEGCLRGWNMNGDARTFYERGIRNAQVECRFQDYKQYYTAAVDKYMQLENAIDYTYVDPMDSKNNHPSVTKIGVKWNDGDPLEVKLEKIITQKYISLYPYANEAWTELRRTGYPKIFPVLNAEDYTDGSYTTPDEILRRIPLPGGGSSEGDADILNSGIPALEFDGSFGDYQYSHIFWDVDRANF